MRKEIEPPESSNPLQANLDGMYNEARAFNGGGLRRAFATVLEASLLTACLNGPVSPTHTGSPDNTGAQTPTSSKVTPAETTTGPTVTGPIAPKVTPTFTKTPTETPTPTENPNAISAEEILAECPVKLEISEVLVGKARVEGQIMEFNYPNVKLDIIFGLHPSIINRGKETGFLPYQEMMINPEFEDRFGIRPEIQIMTDILYTHYRAWQNDEDNKYLTERAGVTFLDYLKMLNQGGDGSHKLWVVSEKGKLYPNEQVMVGPELKHVVIFAESNFGEGGSGAGQIKFDARNSELIFIADPKPDYGTTDPNVAGVKSQGYLSMVSTLGFMIMPEEIQRLGFSGSTPKEMSRYFGKFSFAIFPSDEAWANTALILISHGFGP